MAGSDGGRMTSISTVPGASGQANRYGRKFVIVPATILADLSLLLFLLASSCALFLVGCVMWNVASGVGAAVPTSYVADAAPSGMNAAAVKRLPHDGRSRLRRRADRPRLRRRRRMDVEIQLEAAAEALDRRHGAGLAGRDADCARAMSA